MNKKILVVDDSALMRKVLSDIITYDKRFVLEDSANNGLEAYDLLLAAPAKYDIIILDINMPKMSGIQLMEKLISRNIKIPILIVSTIAKEGASETIRCLELGAFDFITKPDSFVETKSEGFRRRILSLLCAAVHIEHDDTPQTGIKITADRKSEVQRTDLFQNPMSYNLNSKYEKHPHVKVTQGARKLIAVACSTGGPKALQMVVPKLPKGLNAPVLIVQHMPEGFTATLAQRLNDLSEINVKETEDGETLEKGTVYIAKGGKQMRLKKRGKDYVLSLDSDEPRNGLRPCADIMYESLQELDYDEITCVVMTGMGSDGTRGIGQLNQKKNLYVIAQDELSSTVYGMPRMVKEAGLVDEIAELNEIANAITKIVGVN